MRTEDYFREMVGILFAQVRLIVWTVVFVFAGAVAVAFFWPPTFSATSGILVKSKQPEKSPEALDTNVPRRFTEVTKADLASEVELLTSPAVIQATVAALRQSRPEMFPPGTGGAGQEAAVYSIIRHLKTEVIPLSNVVSINFFDKDPARAVDTLNTLLRMYLAKREGIYNVGATTGSFFAEQSKTYRGRLDRNDELIVRAIDETGVADPEKELQNNLNLKLAAQSDLNRLRNAYQETRATHTRLREAVASPGEQYFSYLDSFVIVELSKKLAELNAERSKALKTFHPESDIIKAFDEQVGRIATALKAEAGEYTKNVAEKMRAQEAQIATLERTIAAYDQRNVALRKQLLTMNRLTSDSQLLRFTYETYVKRAEEESVDGSLGSSGITTRVTVLNQAFPSDGPVFPRPAVVLPLAALVGLILGVSLAFLREYFDHTFKKPRDVMVNVGLPVLFSLGAPARPGEARLARGLMVAAAGVLLVAAAILYRLWLQRYYG